MGVPPGLGEPGIPYGAAAPGSAVLWMIVLLGTPGAVAAACMYHASSRRPELIALVIVLALFPMILLAIFLIISRSENIMYGLIWFLNTAYPGFTSFGPYVAWLSVFGTFLPFGYQVVYAMLTLFPKWESISKWYASVTVLNIFAMFLVTFRMTMDQLTSTAFPHGQLTIHDAPWPVAFVTIYLLTLFPIHSMCNVTRLIFDIWGVNVAIKCMIPGYMSQAWLLMPLFVGVPIGYLTVIMAVVDYAQHLTAMVYWLYCTGKLDCE